MSLLYTYIVAKRKEYFYLEGKPLHIPIMIVCISEPREPLNLSINYTKCSAPIIALLKYESDLRVELRVSNFQHASSRKK